MNAQQFLQAQNKAEAEPALVEGVALVVAVDGQRVWLQAEQAASCCGSCATQAVCTGGSHIQTAGNWQVIQPVDGPEGDGRLLAVGDRVRVGIDRNALAHTSLVAYALPLLAMLVAAVSFQDAGNVAAVAAAAAGLVGGIAAARVLARRWRMALQPVILGASHSHETAHAVACAPPSPSNYAKTVPIPVVSAVSPVNRSQ
jgi:sigma-E factor negative regulatory protein RseC